MMASSLARAFWKIGKVNSSSVCCRRRRHFSRPEICRPPPICRTSVAILLCRRRRLLEKCHLQSADGSPCLGPGSPSAPSVSDDEAQYRVSPHSSFSLCDVICKALFLRRERRFGITQLFTHMRSDEGKAWERVPRTRSLTFRQLEHVPLAQPCMKRCENLVNCSSPSLLLCTVSFFHE